MTESRRGLAHGIVAYALWGTAPLFWRLLRQVSPLEILAHRDQLVALSFIWLGLAAFTADLVRSPIDRSPIDRSPISRSDR